jgi:hypothetical protein
VWRRVDDVLRFVYVLFAPVMIVSIGKFVPIGGIMISTGIATVIALAGSTKWITTVRTIPILGRPLANFGRLGEYYRVHAPKPLLYYIAYPLLFPYWLFKGTARREFLAYKRIGLLAVIITVSTALYDYFHNWSPMPRKYFFGAFIGTTFLQLLITFMFVMPIVTTLIGYQKRGHKKSIIALVIASLVLGGGMAYAMRRLEVVSFATQARLRARIQWQPEPARAAMRAALDAPSLEAARETLATVFRPDEVRAFKFAHGKDIALVAAKTRNHEVAWAAKTPTGWVETAAQLPPAVQTALELSPTASAWP